MSSVHTISVSGKIILSGEYAVVFGYPGIAVPSEQMLHVVFEEGEHSIEWKEEWKPYAEEVTSLIEKKSEKTGAWKMSGDLPLGKGMGASTALVIGCCRAALGDECENIASEIEDEVNPGHSGMDFSCIWLRKPIVFSKTDGAKAVTLDAKLLSNTHLIDTGMPDQETSELVAWVKDRYSKESHEESFSQGIKNEKYESAMLGATPRNMHDAIQTIGHCTERILRGEDIKTVIRDHHRAQVALGVVPEETQKRIEEIERGGGAAKVLGAGARTGGGGMVLVFA